MTLKEWALGDCPPWHFWRPQSGYPGGIIAGAIVFAISCLVDGVVMTIWSALRDADVISECRPHRSRRRYGWVSHVVPALGLLAAFGMWLWAVFKLLMLTWGAR